ncbi:MAG: helix-turn-helix domain containing protein [Planctomycetaceae bacterium]|nr:helix-turn-helix domain containing protein [Planctomycetaceae bacterium]
MLNWVAILRRILGLYNVKSQQDLGMALGVPLAADGSLGEGEIPWLILARVVAEKGVSWDWLLTGREFGGQKRNEGETSSKTTGVDPKPEHPDNTSPRSGTAPQRIETREFMRVMIDGDKSHSVTSEEDVAAGQREIDDRVQSGEDSEARLESELLIEAEPEDEAGLLDHLRKLKESMQQEIDRVERLLREKGSS